MANSEEPQPGQGEEGGGRVNFPTVVAAGAAALVGGFLGAQAGASAPEAVGAIINAVSVLVA